MRKRLFWVMDYETLKNCFTAVFIRYDSDEQFTFVVNREHNEFPQFLAFLHECRLNHDWHLGFNNINFDAQITEHILANEKAFRSLNSKMLTAEIYRYAQLVIFRSNNNEFQDYPEFKQTIRCIDIYKLNHWDSSAKRTSLKWAQFSMDWYNVEEMPHPHNEDVNDDDTLRMILEYCVNDVLSTKQIFTMRNPKGEQIMASQINLRAELSKTYSLNLFSASEPRIASEVFLHFLCEKLHIDKKKLRAMRTHRDEVVIRDILLPYLRFDKREFVAVHNWFKSLVVNTGIDIDKVKGPTYRMYHKGVPTDFALGGLHGCIASGVYSSCEKKIIVSADVTSYYPNLAIRNEWSPAHLPQADFCELYEWFFEERKKYGKSNPLNYLYKIVLNSTYGLSKSPHSFLYDPELTFKITTNGQLLLAMLYEMVVTEIPTAQPLMQNTDGLEFLIDRTDQATFYKICRDWEYMTNLLLETVEYDKMIIGDVNNYMAVYTDGKTKCKGRFEFEELPLHKNKSMLIIPKAWYAYFIHGTDPKEFLENNREIFDYCAGAKLKGSWFFIQRGVKNGLFYQDKLQKMLRYYISDKGVKLIKCNPDGREIKLESGPTMVTVFNKEIRQDWDAYGVDDKFYLTKIYDEIRKIESESPMLPQHNIKTQLTLF